ncbi:Signal transduction histidine kinase [Flavobacterium xinjiangense]|uniref:histidine kinase n=2 Tax=Flavobacterium xinjiangense TaxID=178356 RepID=A0A1M7G2V8_9FLAO|nr:Signal transduction histidine kinase [Flavobacterium xinjiangense]
MVKLHRFNTYTKVLLLIILSVILFFSFYFSMYYYTMEQEKEVYDSSFKQFDNEVAVLMKFNSASNISFVSDLTFWDDFVEFTKNKKVKWFQDNIGVSLKIYKSVYLGVYDVKGNFIAKSSNSKIETVDFIPKAAMRRLYHSKLLNFYIKIPEGVVEVFGATIHPTADPLKNKTKPSGYFFMTRLLDDKYLADFGKVCSSKITFVNKNVDTPKKNIYVTKYLKGFDNKPIAKLYFTRPFNVSFQSTKTVLVLILITFLINVFAYVYFSRKWLYFPLNIITSILETGNNIAIKSLKRFSGEFGYIGNLFEENNNHKLELIDAKLKAEESDRLKSSFLDNLSHEIRTPMNAILGFTDLLMNTDIKEKERGDYLKIVSKSGSNLVLIIDDLVEMSKIDANQIVPNYIPLDIETCINELYETIKVSIKKSKKIDFFIIKNDKPVTNKIITDQIKLKQILTNLVSNAIKFTDAGYVAFGYEIDEENNKIVFSVIDSGIGIEKKYHKFIFDRFKRVESDRAIKVGGLGLGLAISKAYVEMLGGSISLESNGTIGSKFIFTIPLIYDESEEISIPNLENKSNGFSDQGITILIAEDDNINFLLFKKIIKQTNHKIIRASNGLEALSICSDNADIDLVLMDIKMPVMNGFDSFEKIKLIRPNLAVVAQTAYSSNEDIEKISKLGFYGYISKPINREKLVVLINEIVSAKFKNVGSNQQV